MRGLWRVVLVLIVTSCAAAKGRVVGWYLGTAAPARGLEHLTHVHAEGPRIYPNGTAVCAPSDAFVALRKAAEGANTTVLWGGGGVRVHEWLFNTSAPTASYRRAFLSSIGRAMTDCGVGGLEIDYEMDDTPWAKLGVVTKAHAKAYSQFLWEVKQASGMRIVSGDVSVWGVAPGNYPLGFLPWVDPAYLAAGKIDWVNTMSYHWARDGNVLAWVKDLFFLLDLWGFPPGSVNLGVPYFSKDARGGGEPTWGGLSPRCPNVHPDENVCDGVVFVGKRMQERIGRLARARGAGGLFPWAAPSYDAYGHNNTLLPWLLRGFHGISGEKNI